MNKITAFSVLVLLGAASAHAADWKSDPAGSTLEFIATFEGNPVPGSFKDFDTQLRLDPASPAAGSLAVTVKVTSADMKIADVNKEIQNKTWFDYAGFPRAEFRSNELRRVDGDHYVARGTLSLKGAQQPVDVPFTFTTGAGDAAMDGELTVKRGPFGIGTGEWAKADEIGADVKVKFKVRLVKAD